MNEQTPLDFSSIQAIVTSEGFEVHSAELHGVITGIIAGGYAFEDTDYVNMIKDLFNNGEALPVKIKTLTKLIYSDVWQSLLDDSYSFNLMLPDDDDTIIERCNALGMWVQGFNLGMGLQQKNNAISSSEVKEVLTDFSQIANLSAEVEEGEETEQDYFELAEYVRISAILCFSELGNLPEKPEQAQTIH